MTQCLMNIRWVFISFRYPFYSYWFVLNDFKLRHWLWKCILVIVYDVILSFISNFENILLVMKTFWVSFNAEILGHLPVLCSFIFAVFCTVLYFVLGYYYTCNNMCYILSPGRFTSLLYTSWDTRVTGHITIS